MAVTKKYVWPWQDVQKSLTALDQLLDDRGPILEIGGYPLRIFVSKHVDFAAAVFSHPRVGITKFPRILPRLRRAMRDKGGFILRGGEEWRAQRNASQAAFRPANYDVFLGHLPLVLEKFLSRWEAQCRWNHGEPVEVFADLRRLFCELNFRMLFSMELDEAEIGRLEEATLFLDLHFLDPIPLWVPTPANLQFRRCLGRLDGAFEKAIEKRKSLGIAPGDSDLMGRLLSQRWEHDRLLGEMASIYFGASVLGTTAAWALYLIGAHPDVEARLAAEAATLTAPGTLRESLAALPYAQAVLKEVLRFYPSSWGFPRYADDDVEIMGCKIPAGSLLVPLIYLTQRDEKYWPDPLAFKPERFLQASPPQNKFAHTPFSAGPRACLGGGLASTLVPLALSMISRRLRYRFAPRFDGDPVADFGFEIHPADGIRVAFSPPR